MTQQILPNIVGQYFAGRQMGEERRDRNTLRELMGPAMQGDPNAQAQVAAISPQHAGVAQSGHKEKLLKMRGAAKYMMAAIQSGDPQKIQAAHSAVAGYLARETGQQVPPQYDDATMRPNIERLLATTEWLDQAGGTPASLQEFNAMTQGLSPEEIAKARKVHLGLEGRASSAAPYGFMEVQGADGRTYLVQTDKIRGGATPVGAAPQGNAPGADDRVTAAMNFMVQQGMDPAAVEAWGMAQLSGAPAPQGPSPFVSPTPGQIKADEVRGGEGAKFAADKERSTFDQEQAAAVERAKRLGQNEAEVQVTAGTRTRDADATLRLLDEAEKLLPDASGGWAASVRDKAAGITGKSTPGAQATASLKLIAAELVAKVPRFEGPQSNIDVQFYREAAGDLANDTLPVQTRMAALRTMRVLREKYASKSAPAKKVVRYDSEGNRLP